MPSATTTNTNTPPASPSVSIPKTLEARRSSESATVTITEIGNATKPIPRTSGSRLTYMRAEVART